MNDKRNDPLERLLRNAALAKPEAAAELSFPVQARILAAWRGSRDETEAFLPLLRKAILAAAMVSALAIAITFATIDTTAEPEADVLASMTNSLEAIELAWTE
jgi:hypothetical protein